MDSQYSRKIKSLDEIWDWYSEQKELLIELKSKVITGLISKEKFQYQSTNEIEEHFKNSIEELEHLVCFDLVSTAEGCMQSDFKNRINSNSFTGFIDILLNEKANDNNISLSQEIMPVWKKFTASKSQVIADFSGILKYRNWLAHGRHWDQKVGEIYNPNKAFKISKELIDVINTN